MAQIAQKIITAGRGLNDGLRNLSFGDPVAYTYLTTDYAQDGYESYVKKFANSPKRVLMLGMNPGPYGMAQTGVPFGEIPAVRDWMKLTPTIHKPTPEHPKRPISGMGCERSEVSGRRLWGLFSEKFPIAEDFFAEHFVVNFCPLIWMKVTGANLTPDKLKRSEMEPVDALCQDHLAQLVDLLQPTFLIGVGAYAEKKLAAVVAEKQRDCFVGKILHPSPASPAANRGWAEAAEKQLIEQRVWSV